MVTSLATDRFTTYGASHQAVMVLLVVGAVALVCLGRSQRATDAADHFSRWFGIAIVVLTVPLQILYNSPRFFDFDRTLPIQLCDLASLAAVYALWTHRAWATALTYFWGLTLTTQAVITPALSADFPDLQFVLYWGMHLLVVLAAIYLVWGLGLAPDWRGYRIAIATTAVWAVSVFVFNLVAGANYGYLNAKPGSASILDLLGPWPWYLVAEIAIIAAVWALMTWPWVVLTANHERGRLPSPR
jgi:hypothetical integral membrane protein (TIGR02206 family)